jgi:hypothetical protein
MSPIGCGSKGEKKVLYEQHGGLGSFVDCSFEWILGIITSFVM